MSRVEDTIIVIQCARSKQPDAGHMTVDMTKYGGNVLFVADPLIAPQCDSVVCHPDAAAPSGRSWRDELEAYNDQWRRQPCDNPLRLRPAWELYKKRAYRLLKDHFGVENLYILSAGWGLVAADFLLPNYNIAFSTSPEVHRAHQRVWCADSPYRDFEMISKNESKLVVFLGEEDYIPPFCHLTSGVKRRKVIFPRTCYPNRRPAAPGCKLQRWPDERWYYKCARQIVSGKFSVCE